MWIVCPCGNQFKDDQCEDQRLVIHMSSLEELADKITESVPKTRNKYKGGIVSGLIIENSDMLRVCGKCGGISVHGKDNDFKFYKPITDAV